jgi:spore germination protein GerM
MNMNLPHHHLKRFAGPVLASCLLGILVLPFISCSQSPSFNPADFFQQNASSLEQVTVFFSKSRGPEVVTEGVVRAVPKEGKQQPLAFAIQELLQGPNNHESTHGFFSEIPKGTRLLGVKEQDNAILINLSRQFTYGGGSTSMQQRLAELKKTVLAVEKKKPVYVDIEGQRLQVLGGEGVMVHEPINKGQENIQ